MSDEDVPSLDKKYYILIYVIFLILFVILTIITIWKFEKKSALELLYKKLIIYITIIVLSWFNGKVLKGYFNIKVNYTRKINHISVWSIPFIADKIIDIDETTLSILWNIYFAGFGQVLWMKPSRKADCTGFLTTSFSSIDRPEDRPNTMKWLAWQNVGVALSIIPFGFLWDYWNVNSFILIPIMIVTFGDGLAEPIGVTFGKHKYKVKACCTNQDYTRSLEGSSMVFFAAIIIIAILNNTFDNIGEFIANIILIPIISTFTEALSPHTLDNPIIIVSVSSVLSLIHLVTITSEKNDIHL
jgi:hypothetical protein